MSHYEAPIREPLIIGHKTYHDITEDIALSAALTSLKYKLPMADSLIFATAQAHGAVLWTQDDHFKSLPGVNYRDTRTKESRGRSKPRT